VRVLLLLVVFGTLAALIAWRAARAFVRRRNNQRSIAALEAENERLDELLQRQQEREKQRQRR